MYLLISSPKADHLHWMWRAVLMDWVRNEDWVLPFRTSVLFLFLSHSSASPFTTLLLTVAQRLSFTVANEPINLTCHNPKTKQNPWG